MSDTESGTNCELLGGFGILVQSVLAVLCFLVLVCIVINYHSQTTYRETEAVVEDLFDGYI